MTWKDPTRNAKCSATKKQWHWSVEFSFYWYGRLNLQEKILVKCILKFLNYKNVNEYIASNNGYFILGIQNMSKAHKQEEKTRKYKGAKDLVVLKIDLAKSL